jgi:hypothetical protein
VPDPGACPAGELVLVPVEPVEPPELDPAAPLPPPPAPAAWATATDVNTMVAVDQAMIKR